MSSITPKHLLTAEQFAALPLAGLRSELIQGEAYDAPHVRGSWRDHHAPERHPGAYFLAQRLGKLYAAETGFLIARDPDTVRAPDIAFIAQARLSAPHSAPRWVPTIPDLVVEVVSSTDRPAEVSAKVAMWLAAGVRLVWVVRPEEHTIDVHQPHAPSTTLTATETLDGADVVPGFMTAVATIFGL